MLIEIWEKLRGYDRWVETTAKVHSVNLEKTAHSDRRGHITYSYASGDRLMWTDRQGSHHSAEFTVDDESSLYQLVGGESIAICYNPAHPEQYYFRELLRSRIRRTFQLARNWAIGLAVLAIFIWLAIATRGR